MPPVDVDDLVRRAKVGELGEGEIAQVAAMLRSGNRRTESYKLLYVIARSNARQYEPLVAEFVEHRDDPMVARLALQTLCTFWGLAETYIDQIERFLEGVEWDSFGDVRQVAITAAGELLREGKNPRLLSRLLALASEENADAVERRVATESVARALEGQIIPTR